jgi:hypothetical protein
MLAEWYNIELNLTINCSLVDNGSESNEIKELVRDLKNKQYVFGIIPEKIIHMNNGIKYYYVEAGINESKIIINAYGREAEQLYEEVHRHSFLINNISQ